MIFEEQVFLERLSDDLRAAAFVFMCAERARPVVISFGSQRAGSVVDGVLEAVWSSRLGHVDANALKNKISSLPEASTDDSNNPSYYAMRAIGIMLDAIRATRSPKAKIAVSASIGMHNLARDIRFHLQDLTAIDSQLDELESMAEAEALERLTQLSPANVEEEFRALRDLARLRAQSFADAAKRLVDAWDG